MVDRELTPDVWDLAGAVEDAYDELLAAARSIAPNAQAPTEPKPKAATKKTPAKRKAPAKKAATKKTPAKRKAPAKKAAAKKTPAGTRVTERGATVRTARKKPASGTPST